MDSRGASTFRVFMKQMVISQLNPKTIQSHINALYFSIITYIANVYIL
jgi:hypothetical protein